MSIGAMGRWSGFGWRLFMQGLYGRFGLTAPGDSSARGGGLEAAE
jgi:hypothetical protein